MFPSCKLTNNIVSNIGVRYSYYEMQALMKKDISYLFE